MKKDITVPISLVAFAVPFLLSPFLSDVTEPHNKPTIAVLGIIIAVSMIFFVIRAMVLWVQCIAHAAGLEDKEKRVNWIVALVLFTIFASYIYYFNSRKIQVS